MIVTVSLDTLVYPMKEYSTDIKQKVAENCGDSNNVILTPKKLSPSHHKNLSSSDGYLNICGSCHHQRSRGHGCDCCHQQTFITTSFSSNTIALCSSSNVGDHLKINRESEQRTLSNEVLLENSDLKDFISADSPNLLALGDDSEKRTDTTENGGHFNIPDIMKCNNVVDDDSGIDIT